jgi:uncharacterized repeat protein (TIGR03803 family)
MNIVSRRSENFTLLRIFTALTVVCGFLATAAPAFAANTEQVLYSFADGTDGAFPGAPLIFDGNGNLYGTTSNGGAFGYGTVFELSPANGGGWAETTLHSFNYNGTDGFGPSGLVFDSFGNLYGTTTSGGSGTACSQHYGTVYELSPAGGGVWTETILYNFPGGNDGALPEAVVILDAQGNLYGTTLEGGAADRGTVFELAFGTWTETTLHSFHHSSAKDGSYPAGALIFDSNGNLYGTTSGGGSGGACPGHSSGCGTVFELAPNGQGGWTETVLHSFTYKGLFLPGYALVFGANGNLYGTTGASRSGYYGGVFELRRSAKGAWAATILHKFTTVKGGTDPNAGLVFDSQGNLYGATVEGGKGCGVGVGCGLVFKLTPSKAKWIETTVFTFNDKDGALPETSLIFDSSGNLYGDTLYGGSGSCSNDGITGCGTVFEIKP